MATNQGSTVIETFYANNMAHLSEEKKHRVNTEPLLHTLQSNFIDKFGAPFAGRIRAIIPFFPFSEHEQAVVAHSFISSVAESYRRDINIPTKDLLGRTHVLLHKDEEVCAHIARTTYNTKLGARAIKNGVDRHIKLPLDKLWRDHDEEFDAKMNVRPLPRYVVQLAKEKNGESIHVFEKGTTVVADEVR